MEWITKMTTNKEMLKKLSLGKEDKETVNITFEDETIELTLRPLTDGELTKLQTIEKQSMNIKIGMQNGQRKTVQTMNDVDINTGEFSKDQTEAMYTAIALSLSVDGEKVTTEDVQQLKAGLPQVIFNEIIRISKLSDTDLTIIKSFRKDG